MDDLGSGYVSCVVVFCSAEGRIVCAGVVKGRVICFVCGNFVVLAYVLKTA